MTHETAAKLSELMLSIGAQLDESIQLVRENESDADFHAYRDAASKLLTTMLIEVMNPLYAEHPDLKPKQLR